MVEADSDYPEMESSVRHRTGKKRRSQITGRVRSRQGSRANRPRPSGHNHSRYVEIVRELQEMMFVLRLAYSTCIVAELALQGQNADQDRDVVATLRHNVSEPVSRQVERLSALTAKLGGRPTEACT